jgi:P4 family phage/plasmid primase-like protien
MQQEQVEQEQNPLASSPQPIGDPRQSAAMHDPGGTAPDPALLDCGAIDPHRSPKEPLPAELLLNALWQSPTLRHQIGSKGPDSAFSNHSASNASKAVAAATALSNQGLDAYFACAEFAEPDKRTAANALQACGFWLDIDCGPSKAEAQKGYIDTAAARAAVLSFCQTAELPTPTHWVNSGAGLHLYWCVDRPIARDPWVEHGKRLKALTAALGFLADPSRTADIASVLRIPGTLNHKYDPPKPVVLESAGPALSHDDMLQRIASAHERLCALPTTTDSTAAPSESSGRSYGPPDLAGLASSLKLLDPDCEESTWSLRRIAPLAREAREHPGFAAGLYALARTWSSGELRGQPSTKWQKASTAGGKSGAEVFDATWARFLKEEVKGTETTLGTIYHDAKLIGWQASLTDSAERAQAEQTTLTAELLADVKTDASVPMDSKYVPMLAKLSKSAPAEYQRLRQQLKQANKDVPLTAIDKVVKSHCDPDDLVPTHHGFALDLLRHLTVDNHEPAFVDGQLYTVSRGTNLWVALAPGQLERQVAERYDTLKNCARAGEYAAIANHAEKLASAPDHFADAPVGIACPDGFYQVKEGRVTVAPLRAEDRQRVQVDFSPTDMPTPMFDAFLHETFQSPTGGEEVQQLGLVQEIGGSIMVGFTHRYQKAVQFYDPYGRAGKGTLVSIIERLVPKPFRTSVSPFQWDGEYYLATMAGARLNSVGELPDDKSIPAAAFKSVMGQDLLMGRHPHGRPMPFKNSAAHIFSSNHLINSRDQTEAFFARWLLVEFPNSRLVSGKALDPGLADRIIANELPGIAYWALEGAKRVLVQNGFSSSSVHDRLMAKWRRGNSSLAEFIHDSCELAPTHRERKSEFYRAYVTWCGANGRKAYAKGTVKDHLSANLKLGIRLGSVDGYEVFHGVRLQADDRERSYNILEC